MKEQIKKLKLELKELAKQIKEKKSQRKSSSCGYVSGLHEARVAFRHKHVAYCLARGRTLEQVDKGERLNMDHVQWYMDSMKPESKKKLYAVVSDKLTPSQQAVQAGHAVAEFLKKNPHTQWDNGYLIYLTEAPGFDGNMRGYRWMVGSHQYAEFVEPDLGNKITAYALFGPEAERILQRHKLL